MVTSSMDAAILRLSSKSSDACEGILGVWGVLGTFHLRNGSLFSETHGVCVCVCNFACFHPLSLAFTHTLRVGVATILKAACH